MQRHPGGNEPVLKGPSVKELFNEDNVSVSFGHGIKVEYVVVFELPKCADLVVKSLLKLGILEGRLLDLLDGHFGVGFERV